MRRPRADLAVPHPALEPQAPLGCRLLSVERGLVVSMGQNLEEHRHGYPSVEATVFRAHFGWQKRRPFSGVWARHLP